MTTTTALATTYRVGLRRPHEQHDDLVLATALAVWFGERVAGRPRVLFLSRRRYRRVPG